LDIFLDDPNWAEWSEAKLEKFGSITKLFINPIVYSEVSIGFKRIEALKDHHYQISILVHRPQSWE
jgi:hypothetical protein